jgi:hypothetical protein
MTAQSDAVAIAILEAAFVLVVAPTVVAVATAATIAFEVELETAAAIAAMTVAPVVARIAASHFDSRSNTDRSSIPDPDSPSAVSMIQALCQAYD